MRQCFDPMSISTTADTSICLIRKDLSGKIGDKRGGIWASMSFIGFPTQQEAQQMNTQNKHTVDYAVVF